MSTIVKEGVALRLGGRTGARTKLLIWLILPSLILEAAIIWLAQSNTTSFLRQTQESALNGMVVQSVRLMESQMNDLVLNVLAIENEILYDMTTPADWIRSMEAATQTRPELVRGVVYLDKSGLVAGSYDTRTLLYDRNDRLIYSITIVARNSYETLEFAERDTKTLSAAKANFEKNEQYYVISDMNQAPFWKVVIVGDVKTLENNYQPIVQFAIMILLLGSAGLVFIYIIVSWWFTKPIVSLTKGIRHIATGHLDHQFEVSRPDEFGEMAREFNRMMRIIQELIETLKQTEEQKRQADFQMLLAQINPHFLYNTLNTIDIMVDFKSKAEIHAVMTVLIRLLKYGLDRTDVLRRLDEELTYVKDYLYIQSVR
ncbi:sensor histidine kinase [Paenibacillus sp. GCM10027626]|uniref:sensor histidine kinase n=1 Tax=Paenibacillus sp. GCM10027626 TaxID=3273411 RepID=UPI00362DA776